MMSLKPKKIDDTNNIVAIEILNKIILLIVSTYAQQRFNN